MADTIDLEAVAKNLEEDNWHQDAKAVRAAAKRLAEVEQALLDGKLGLREDYFPVVAEQRQKNREMHDRAQCAEVRAQRAESRVAFLEANFKALLEDGQAILAHRALDSGSEDKT